MSIQYIMSRMYFCIDETMIIVTLEVKRHICQCYSVPLLLLITIVGSYRTN